MSARAWRWRRHNVNRCPARVDWSPPTSVWTWPVLRCTQKRKHRGEHRWPKIIWSIHHEPEDA